MALRYGSRSVMARCPAERRSSVVTRRVHDCSALGGVEARVHPWAA